MKYKFSTLFFALFGFAFGIGTSPAIGVIRSLACNTECKAQLLYKNTVFYEVRGAITSMKNESATKVPFDQSRYTPEYLRDNGIDLLVVLDSGEFILTSRLDRLAMLAKPTYVDGRLIWHCHFLGDKLESPGERACSY